MRGEQLRARRRTTRSRINVTGDAAPQLDRKAQHQRQERDAEEPARHPRSDRRASPPARARLYPDAVTTPVSRPSSSSSDVRDTSAGRRTRPASSSASVRVERVSDRFGYFFSRRFRRRRSSRAHQPRPPRASRRTEPVRSSVGGGRASRRAPPRAMVRSRPPPEPRGCRVAPRTSAPSAPIDASRVAHRWRLWRPSCRRRAWRSSSRSAAAGLAEAGRARVKAVRRPGVRVVRTVDAREPRGRPRRRSRRCVRADALAVVASLAQMAGGCARARQPLNGGSRWRAARRAHREGRGCRAPRDHARANDAFAEARASNASPLRGRRVGTPTMSAAASVTARRRTARHIVPRRENARPPAAAFAPASLRCSGWRGCAIDGRRSTSTAGSPLGRGQCALACWRGAREPDRCPRDGLIAAGNLPKAASSQDARVCARASEMRTCQCAFSRLRRRARAAGAVDASWVARRRTGRRRSGLRRGGCPVCAARTRPAARRHRPIMSLRSASGGPVARVDDAPRRHSSTVFCAPRPQVAASRDEVDARAARQHAGGDGAGGEGDAKNRWAPTSRRRRGRRAPRGERRWIAHRSWSSPEHAARVDYRWRPEHKDWSPGGARARDHARDRDPVSTATAEETLGAEPVMRINAGEAQRRVTVLTATADSAAEPLAEGVGRHRRLQGDS